MLAGSNQFHGDEDEKQFGVWLRAQSLNRMKEIRHGAGKSTARSGDGGNRVWGESEMRGREKVKKKKKQGLQEGGGDSGRGKVWAGFCWGELEGKTEGEETK